MMHKNRDFYTFTVERVQHQICSKSLLPELELTPASLHAPPNQIVTLKYRLQKQDIMHKNSHLLICEEMDSVSQQPYVVKHAE